MNVSGEQESNVVLGQLYRSKRSQYLSHQAEEIGTTAEQQINAPPEGVRLIPDVLEHITAIQLVELLQALQVEPLVIGTNSLGREVASLGEGGFGEVRYTEVEDLDGSGEAGAAIKEFKQSSSSTLRNVDELRNEGAIAISQAYLEICIMKHPRLVEHPNILQLLGTTSWSRWSNSADWGELCLVAEYADLGSLDVYLQRHPNRSWSFKRRIIGDVAAGLQALHDCDIVHNDIKCGNVLLFSQYNPGNARITAKIADFGCAVPLAKTKKVSWSPGTSYFAAPETYPSNCIVSPSRDIYSFGLLFLQILTDECPFSGYTDDRRAKLKRDSAKMSSYVTVCLTQSETFREITIVGNEIRELLQSILESDVKKRLTDLGEVAALVE